LISSLLVIGVAISKTVNAGKVPYQVKLEKNIQRDIKIKICTYFKM